MPRNNKLDDILNKNSTRKRVSKPIITQNFDDMDEDDDEELSPEEYGKIYTMAKKKADDSKSDDYDLSKINLSVMSKEDAENVKNILNLKKEIIESDGDPSLLEQIKELEKQYYDIYKSKMSDKKEKLMKNLESQPVVKNPMKVEIARTEVVKPVPRGRTYQKNEHRNVLQVVENKPIVKASGAIELINSNLNNKDLLERTLADWRPILAKECQVYVYNQGYLAKRWNTINYEFCDEDSAKEILINNLNALLRFSYFKVNSDEVEEYIERLVKGFVRNINTSVMAAEFDDDNLDDEDSMDDEFVNVKVIDDGSYRQGLTKLKHIPNSCIAFRNGVYDFKTNEWLFKYNVTYITNLTNYLYTYDSNYVVLWYLDYVFKPMFDNLSIVDTELSDFIDYMIKRNKEERCLTFELVHNMCFDSGHKFSLPRFTHICEVLGYLAHQGFLQHFVMLVGEGQNGKNSLIDGCFTCKVKPTPTSNDLLTIETDKFITGTLLNRSHNIFLETSQKAETYKDSKNIKNLTGSQYQTIEEKGVKRYSSYLNCKFIFSANNQEAIKFSDTTHGFRRRINVLELFYTWDEEKKFMKRGDYLYNPTYSDDYHEFKTKLNLETYIYLAMFGIKSGTRNFTKQFKFTQNDWNLSYSDVDIELKEKIENLSLTYILDFVGGKKNTPTANAFKEIFRDDQGELLYKSQLIKNYDPNIVEFNDMIKAFKDPEFSGLFFTENDVYLNVKILQQIIYGNETNTQGKSFASSIKKTFRGAKIANMTSNKAYVLIGFAGDRLRIRNI